jgi:hypothetical protein
MTDIAQRIKAHEAEIARIESLADSDNEFEGAIRVEGTIAPNHRTYFQLEIGADDLTELLEVASARGQSVSEFICVAAMRAARDGAKDLPAPVVEAVDELVRRYEAARQASKPRRATRRKAS